jgi:PIN domain nuclease of toxin-antitoxin system
VQSGKLAIPMDIHRWYELARSYPSTVIEPLSPVDAIASTQLPGDFHKDPADRIIVALARRLSVPLLTCDRNILDYKHVVTVW